MGQFRLAIVVVCLGGGLARGQAIQEWHGHRAAVYAVAFQPNGQHMATASFDHTIKVWDVESGRVVRSFSGHQDKVLALAYSADGRRFASAGLDGTVRLWDAATSRPLACLTSRNRCVQGIAFTPDGSRLIACGDAGIAEVWRTGSVSCRVKGACRVEGIVERTIAVEPERMPLFAAAVSPDGQTLALAGLDGRIRLHDLATGKRRRTLEGHADAVYSLAFSPDGDCLASGSVDQTVRCWQTATGVQRACLDGHQGTVYQVGFSADGRRLVSAGGDGEVIVWDAGNGSALHRQRFPGKALCAAFTPDGRRIAAGSERSACYLLELPRHVR